MRRKKLFTFIVATGCVVLLVIGYNRVRITNIECQSQFGPCDEEIENVLNPFKGTTLLKAYSGIRKVLNEHPKVARYTVQFSNPSTLQAEIMQRRPQVAVIAEGDDQYYLYSEEGVLLDMENETQLPTVRIMDISVITEEQMQFVVAMAYILNQTYNVQTVVIQQGGMEFEVTGAPKIIFPVQGDIDVLLGSLTFVLSQLNSQLGDFRMEFIDFRFKNPVIKVID